ncbi:Zeta toxin family protein [Castellaniella sp.]|uniref:Zeta toxin family protein n=1 Tax=Castellaniella sp. TaxID=1955812 RepID=UPI002AFF0102|nr:Zeta toxin family protein [Castellaniella sp.]
MNVTPTCWIIAGPNGAGKTTFALDYLPAVAQCQTFINADLIAAGLSPLNPEREQLAASRLYLAEIDRCERACQNFAFETTLSGRGYLRLVDRLMQSGWRVEMSYLALSNVQLSHDRVAERVAHGGHGIPTEAIERRFARSLYNLFELYAPRVSLTRCYLNSQDNPDLVFTQQGNHVEILDDAVYRHLRNEAGL